MLRFLQTALLLWLAAAVAAMPAHAGTVVSDHTDSVSVTVYRQPGRARGAIDPNWPGGYALVTETRTIDLPEGESVIRFEGVAEGLMPETAVISGLPRGVREKNRDARLLSPAGLVDAYLKRSVTLRRTDRKTGKVTEQDAIISAGPNGGVIVQTAVGFEAMGCSGLPERMLFREVPKDLSPRPTLSVIAQSAGPVRVTLQLIYLAEGFDWAANYVAQVKEGGRRIDLMGWITLANGGVTGFRDARLSVIAGQPNKSYRDPQPRPTGGALTLQCWPMDITSTHPRWELFPVAVPVPVEQMAATTEIMVTAQRRSRRNSVQYEALPPPPPPPAPPPEDVGDLKLYRVPESVDIGAKNQKQVALLRQSDVVMEPLYAAQVGYGDGAGGSRPMKLRLRLQNRKEDGLGIALPSGRVAVFEQIGGNQLLVGEADIGDKAVDERVDYDIADSSDVQMRVTRTVSKSKKLSGWAIEISNARPFDIVAEVMIPQDITPRPEGMERRGRAWILRLPVPANDKAGYSYTVKEQY